MVYVRFYRLSMNDTVLEFLLANHPKTDLDRDTIFSCLEGYLNKYNDPLMNITMVATDGAPAMVGRYTGFSGFLREKVPTVNTAHCVVHRQHLLSKQN